MPFVGLIRAGRVRARLRGAGCLTERLSRRSMRTFDGRLARALVGLVLALHLVGGSGFNHAARGDATPGAGDVASLSAALGQPIPTCHHGDADHPDAPAVPDGCDHCICGQAVPGNVALDPDFSEVQEPARSPQRVAYPARENANLRSSRAGRTTARGPPALS